MVGWNSSKWGNKPEDRLHEHRRSALPIFLVSCKRCSGSLLVRNDGAGDFEEDRRGLPQYTNNYEFEAMDLDGDGFLDLVTINDGEIVGGIASSRREHVFLNNGEGRFRDMTGPLWPVAQNIGEDDNVASFLDYDSDGDADFLVGSLSGPDRLIVNDGSGRLRSANEVFFGAETPGTLGVAIADLAGDGRIDVVQAQGEVPGAEQERIFFGRGLERDAAPPVVSIPSAVRSEDGLLVRARVHDRKSPSLPGSSDSRRWEGRPLVILVIGSPDRMAGLDDVKADLTRLAQPYGLSDSEADVLIAELPVVTALMHGVHGNEISSSGAAMAEAYHLLAAQDDPTVDLILAESLVLIDPVENPDGRARFVQHNTMSRARWPNEATYSAEHDEPWPGGRVNHYLFDLNRDLFTQSQPETQGKVDVFLDFWPHIVADLHEMGGNSTYFFPPTAPPENPWYGERQIALMDVFGRANASVFDRRGFSYFNRDVYDLFYPGYVDMWPMSHAALGMTYEQASARALVLRKDDGDLLTYGD